ncbi:MAG: hypothetical protein ACKOYN_09345 [Planctomycetota bacterium]
MRIREAIAACLLALAPAAMAADDGLSARIEANLAKAGANRGQISAFLEGCADSGDPQKLAAARFLVANMDGHGFARIALVAKDGREIPYEALDHASLNDAKKALDAIETQNPGADFARTRFDSDLEHASAAFLRAHLDEAFDAWRTYPWAKSISFEAFCNHILPYRGSNEPLGAWRAPARERLAALCAQNAGETDVRAVGEKVRATVHPWCGFSDIFYLHPTDQSYGEMCERKLGRCEDITNMVSFGMRSVATMCASDYTPWWAASDNNHAWEVVLDAAGNGRAGLAGRAAKVYRKTFAHQPDSLGAIKPDGVQVPRWLSGTHYIDVTAQYQPVTDVTVALDGLRDGERYAYLAVFNGGAWRPIHWGHVKDGRATFTAMGRSICYLPMTHRDGADVPAGPPFVVCQDGIAHTLAAKDAASIALAATTTKPDIQDPDTGVVKVRTVVKPDAAFELFVWRDGWKSAGRIEKGRESHLFEGLSADGLYWLVEDGSERLERIFTVDGGKQVFW